MNFGFSKSKYDKFYKEIIKKDKIYEKEKYFEKNEKEKYFNSFGSAWKKSLEEILRKDSEDSSDDFPFSGFDVKIDSEGMKVEIGGTEIHFPTSEDSGKVRINGKEIGTEDKKPESKQEPEPVPETPPETPPEPQRPTTEQIHSIAKSVLDKVAKGKK